MDLSALNPFRKSKTIYNWDDNWRPYLLTATGDDGGTVTFNLIVPDYLYGSILWINVTQENAGGIGSNFLRLFIYRGSDRIFYPRWNNSNQLSLFVDWFIFPGAQIIDSSLASAVPVWSIPEDFPLLPGDRIECTITSTKTTPINPKIALLLKAYFT